MVHRPGYTGPDYVIVGTRSRGDTLIIEQRPTKREAEARAAELRESLDGYSAIVVERVKDRGIKRKDGGR